MEQKETVMVLFDREEEYARLLSEFLRRQKELHGRSIHTQRWRNCWNGRKMGR